MSLLEPTAALNKALAEAQGEFPAITRSKTVKTPSYSYKYAPLDEILDACRPILSKHGLAVVQLLEDTGQGPALRTELRHRDGGGVGSSFPLPSEPGTLQQLGSTLTYLRRYAIVALLAIAPEDDDDGDRSARSTPAAGRTVPVRPDAGSPWTDRQRKAIYALRDELAAEFPPPEPFESWDDAAHAAVQRRFGHDSLSKLTRVEADQLLESMRDHQRILRDQQRAAQVDDVVDEGWDNPGPGFRAPDGALEQQQELG